jgi:hypothetical protein
MQGWLEQKDERTSPVGQEHFKAWGHPGLLDDLAGSFSSLDHQLRSPDGGGEHQRRLVRGLRLQDTQSEIRWRKVKSLMGSMVVPVDLPHPALYHPVQPFPVNPKKKEKCKTGAR